MPGHSGALLVALHHQIWGLLPPYHHVPPVVRCSKAILAFRSYKSQFTVGFQSAGSAAWKGQGLQGRFPDLGMLCTSKPLIVQFKGGHHYISNALLGQQGPHKAIEWQQEMQIKSHLHRASYTSQDAHFPLQKSRQLPRQHWLTVAAPSCPPSSIRLSSAGQTSTDSSPQT